MSLARDPNNRQSGVPVFASNQEAPPEFVRATPAEPTPSVRERIREPFSRFRLPLVAVITLLAAGAIAYFNLHEDAPKIVPSAKPNPLSALPAPKFEPANSARVAGRKRQEMQIAEQSEAYARAYVLAGQLGDVNSRRRFANLASQRLAEKVDAVPDSKKADTAKEQLKRMIAVYGVTSVSRSLEKSIKDIKGRAIARKKAADKRARAAARKAKAKAAAKARAEAKSSSSKPKTVTTTTTTRVVAPTPTPSSNPGTSNTRPPVTSGGNNSGKGPSGGGSGGGSGSSGGSGLNVPGGSLPTL